MAIELEISDYREEDNSQDDSNDLSNTEDAVSEPDSVFDDEEIIPNLSEWRTATGKRKPPLTIPHSSSIHSKTTPEPAHGCSSKRSATDFLTVERFQTDKPHSKCHESTKIAPILSSKKPTNKKSFFLSIPTLHSQRIDYHYPIEDIAERQHSTSTNSKSGTPSQRSSTSDMGGIDHPEYEDKLGEITNLLGMWLKRIERIEEQMKSSSSGSSSDSLHKKIPQEVKSLLNYTHHYVSCSLLFCIIIYFFLLRSKNEIQNSYQ